MGWTGIKTRRSLEEVFKDEFASQLYGNIIVKYSIVNIPKSLYDDYVTEQSEIYCAWKCNNGAIACVTIIIERINDEVLYKVQDDTVGPYTLTKCPKEILNLLSPFDKYDYIGYAKEWRERQYA